MGTREHAFFHLLLLLIYLFWIQLQLYFHFCHSLRRFPCHFVTLWDSYLKKIGLRSIYTVNWTRKKSKGFKNQMFIWIGESSKKGMSDSSPFLLSWLLHISASRVPLDSSAEVEFNTICRISINNSCDRILEYFVPVIDTHRLVLASFASK